MNDAVDQQEGAPVQTGAPSTVEEAEVVMRIDTSFEVEADGRRKRVLAKPIRAHNGQTVTVIYLRKPRYRDIMSFGDPSTLIYLDGGVVPQNDMSVVEKYINSLVEGIEPGLLEQCDYVDAIALRDAVLSFFRPTRMKGSMSAQTSSFSG